MTDPGGGQQTHNAGPSQMRGIGGDRSLVTGRRSFVGLMGWLLVGTGSVSAGTTHQVSGFGYGDGGYGEGGFGSNAPTVEGNLASYEDTDGIVRSSGVSEAFEDWMGDDIGTALLLDVINAWFIGEPVSDESG